jgi:hypothetical protein
MTILFMKLSVLILTLAKYPHSIPLKKYLHSDYEPLIIKQPFCDNVASLLNIFYLMFFLDTYLVIFQEKSHLFP